MNIVQDPYTPGLIEARVEAIEATMRHDLRIFYTPEIGWEYVSKDTLPGTSEQFDNLGDLLADLSARLRRRYYGC